jgi:hypothetical protein
VDGVAWGVLGGVVIFGFRLIFLWKVYRLGGREDLKAAGEALRRDLGWNTGRAEPDPKIVEGETEMPDQRLLPPDDGGDESDAEGTRLD